MKQKNMDTNKGVMDECQDDTSIAMMQDCVNKNLDNINRKHLNEINEIGVDVEWVETKDIENEDVIHRNITENEQETNRYTLKNTTEECPDDQLYENKRKTA